MTPGLCLLKLFAPLRHSRFSQSSQTLFSIETRALLSLEAVENSAKGSPTTSLHGPSDPPRPPGTPPGAPTPPDPLHTPTHPWVPPPQSGSMRPSIPSGTAAAPPRAHAGQEAHFSYRNRVFNNMNCLRGDGRRDSERRIASFPAAGLGPGWLQRSPLDFLVRFRVEE